MLGGDGCTLALRLIAFDRARNSFQYVARRLFPYPWMTSIERYILLGIHARHRPATCLEWGSGFSTRYFPRFSPGLERWVAVEHHAEWYELLKGSVRDPRVELVHVPPDRQPFSGPEHDGTYDELRRYVDYPASLGARFDFVMVDGRARAACLDKAHGLLSGRGLVVLHDAQREYYRAAVGRYAHSYTFVDPRNGKALSVMGDAVDPTAVVDVRALEEVARCAMLLHTRLEVPVRDRLVRWWPSTRQIFSD